jgi:hypothetical protein
VVVGGTMFTPIVCGKELEYAGGVSVYDFVGKIFGFKPVMPSSVLTTMIDSDMMLI